MFCIPGFYFACIVRCVGLCHYYQGIKRATEELAAGEEVCVCYVYVCAMCMCVRACACVCVSLVFHLVIL